MTVDRAIENMTVEHQFEVPVLVQIRTIGYSHCSNECPQLTFDGSDHRCRLATTMPLASGTLCGLMARSEHCRTLVRERDKPSLTPLKAAP
jgi:hypothetical protein